MKNIKESVSAKAGNNRIKENTHILSQSYITSTDTRKTGLNNNVLIFGPSGSGKTRHYVRPNLLNSGESMIISDTKGNLYDELGPALRKKGYKVENINFMDFSKSTIGYNPLDYISYDSGKGRYSEKDILTLVGCLASDKISSEHEPFWENAAKQYLSLAVGYVLEILPESDRNLTTVTEFLNLFDRIHRKRTVTSPGFTRKGTAVTVADVLMNEVKELCPESTLSTMYESIRDNRTAEKMHASIKGIVSTALHPLLFDDAVKLYTNTKRIDFRKTGKEKTAVFLTISDTDRSMDALANTLMTQAIQTLCRVADSSPGNRLRIPVRFYLDDFATNLFIPDFDKIISVIRSREISVSVILQSITQLNSLYGDDRAKTIMNNCDRQLYLGGQDPDTAHYISLRANRPLDRILSMPLEEAYLFVRGQEPMLTRKYDRVDLVADGTDKKTGNEPEMF